MLESTLKLIETCLRSDSTVGAAERQRLMRRLCGTTTVEQPTPPRDRILRRAQAAEMLGRSTKTIDRLASEGVLRRITFPTRKRSAGFRLSDLDGLVAGRTPKPTSEADPTDCEG